MSLISDRDTRNKLKQEGVGVANDLTRAQAHVVAQARKDGKRAYFRRGKMVIGPPLPDPRTYAEVTATGTEGGGQQINTRVSGDTGTTQHTLSLSHAGKPGAADPDKVSCFGVMNSRYTTQGSQQQGYGKGGGTSTPEQRDGGSSGGGGTPAFPCLHPVFTWAARQRRQWW
eukprot:TRINITY_DN93097_c0_g1_i6.p1 TRINITY_DN93097_c0_g1~~TRINITY_DN93097_c0_g1_i6.p1  ORF type:complete len:171 (+),score=31.07 TRINITY_DN93097_c0_g1_i6:60-572(+)